MSFEIADRVFADPFAAAWRDRIENAELRCQTLGVVEGYLLLLVAHLRPSGCPLIAKRSEVLLYWRGPAYSPRAG